MRLEGRALERAGLSVSVLSKANVSGEGLRNGEIEGIWKRL